MYRFFLLFIGLIISILGISQSPLRLSFQHLTREDGLSNTNVFYSYTDSRGFIWLGSNNGLNRFDGVNVRVYRPTNSAFRGIIVKNIVEDKNGNLWIGSEAGLNFYNRKTDTFHPIESPTKEKEFSSFPHIIDNNGLLWVVLETKKRGLYAYNPASKQYSFITDQVSDHISDKQNRSFQPVNQVFCGGKNGVGLRKLSFKDNNLIRIETFFEGKNKQPTFNNIKEYLVVENDSTVWITGDTAGLGLVKFNPLNNTFRSFKSEILTLGFFAQSAIFKNYILLGSTGGLYIFDKISEKFVQHIQFSAENANGISLNWVERPYIDKNNNLFLSFSNDFTNLNREIAEHWLMADEAKKLKFSDNHITLIHKRGNQVWAKLQNGGTVVFDKFGKFLNYYKDFSTALIDSDNNVWLSTNQSFYKFNPEKNQKKEYHFKELDGQMGWDVSMKEIEKGVFMIASKKGLFEFTEKDSNLKPVLDYNAVNRINTTPTLYDSGSKQLFASANWWQEFYVLSKENSTWKIKKQINFPFRVVAIKQSKKKGKLWLGTSKGLALLDTHTFDYQLFTQKDGLPDESVTDIVEEDNGNHWLVTDGGISYFDSQKKTYRNFGRGDGVYSKEYDWNCAFKLPDNRVVFGGTDGITVINPDAIRNYFVKPKIQITQFFVNEKPLNLPNYIGETEQIELQPNQNSFALNLVGIEYGFPQKVKVQYQLQGYDNQWITSKNPAIARYTNVSEGTYQFLVKATDENEKVSSEIRKLTIVVYAPFYRTAWFRSLLVASLILLGYAFYRIRLKQVREETQKKEEIRRIRAEAEISALRSQMNPHFIFNCLNTIDSYILLNKTDEASEFLNKFSKLIRMILENSREEFIPLEQDLKALELYIKLEQERSFPKFIYEINIDSNLSENHYFIPSMLIQPFVENAILHGIRHKKDDIGELLVNLKVADNQIVVHIIDNGIGREASQKLNHFKNLNKRSVGLKITEERIQKLNEIYEGKVSFKVIDIVEGNDRGTIIEIYLPQITQEQIRK